MRVDIITTSEQFESLHEEWNGLLQCTPADCVFLTHEWLNAWWKHLSDDRQLSIVTARSNGRLVGIMPLALRDSQFRRMMPRVLELLGSGVIGSDYLDILTLPGCEGEVIPVFADHLKSMDRVLQLSQLKQGTCTALNLVQHLQRERWHVCESKINICPFINLKGHTWETYLAGIGSSQRYNFNRRLKNLTRTSGFRFECITTAADALAALDIVIHLHRKRWAAVGRSEAFQTDSIVEFHRDFALAAANRNWLRIFVLRMGETPVAALYGFHYGSTFYFYQSGFDPDYGRQSVGLVMMGLTIQAAICERADEYDFLHGDEEYKFHWTTTMRGLSRIELCPPRTQIYRRAMALNRAARKMARRVLTRD